MIIDNDKLDKASQGLRGIAHPTRLAILCHLASGPMNVGELMLATDVSQASLSQHLAKLRLLNILKCERQGQQMFYQHTNPAFLAVINAIKDVYCPDNTDKPQANITIRKEDKL